MTCREFAEFLDAWLAGELSPAERTEFDRHLKVCDHCVAYLQNYRTTVDLCRQLQAAKAVPPSVPDDLVRAVLAARKPK